MRKKRKGVCKEGECERGGEDMARVQPGLLQVVTWQMPVMFLTSATLCMIIGLFLHVWSAAPHIRGPEAWDDDSKVRGLFLFLLSLYSQFTSFSEKVRSRSTGVL